MDAMLSRRAHSGERTTALRMCIPHHKSTAIRPPRLERRDLKGSHRQRAIDRDAEVALIEHLES